MNSKYIFVLSNKIERGCERCQMNYISLFCLKHIYENYNARSTINTFSLFNEFFIIKVQSNLKMMSSTQ